ncbi:MAG: 50S ribosomal protein L24 [Blastocatellia bacterium]|nr:50S ribosomal protein L24 [Blastocatellia bacterium]
MPAKAKVTKNDLVVVLAGKDVGKRARVLEVKPSEGKVLVEGVAVVQRHTRRNAQRSNVGGIIEREAMIDISNVQVVCPSCGAPTRVAIKILEDGTRKRQCKKCSAIIERR